MPLQSYENLQAILWWGRLCAPHHIISFRDFEELVFNKAFSILTILLILRRFFQWCRRIFPNLSTSKVEKMVERSIGNPGLANCGKKSLICT